MAILLHAEFNEDRKVFVVEVQMDNEATIYRENMTVDSFHRFCQRIDEGFAVGMLKVVFTKFPILSKRTRRGIIQYFKQVEKNHRKSA